MLRRWSSFIKNISLFLTLLIISILLAPNTFGQRIENLRLEQFGDKILIHYDFTTKNQNDAYQLKAYHSADNYDKPLNLIKGDVGDRVLPGKGKIIEWYAREELGSYKGAIIVEIRIFESPENIYIQYPATSTKIKRGNTLTINWSGGISEDKVSIQLYADGEQVETIANKIENNGKHKWLTSKKMKPGKNYTVHISGAKEAQSTSGTFTIKRRVPVWLMVAPIAIVGAAVGIIISNGSKTGGNGNLPGAPNPN